MPDQYPHPSIDERLGPRLREIEAESRRSEVIGQLYGWLARDLLASERLLERADLEYLGDVLDLLPNDYPTQRLLVSDHVDATWSEAQVISGLRRRHWDAMNYEGLTTSKGKNPDVNVPMEKLIYEVRHLGPWEPALDRQKIADYVYRELRPGGLRHAITLRFTHAIAFREEWKRYAAMVVDAARRMLQLGTLAETILLPNPDGLDDKPKLIVTLSGAPGLSVEVRAPNVFLTSSRVAAGHAREHNKLVGAVAAVPAGISTLDHARAKAKSKIRQLEPDWLGIIVLVTRVEDEPRIAWDVVLEQLLEGDELLEIAVDGSEGPGWVKFPRTGLGGSDRNRRLLGIIGCTINYRGSVVEFRGARNPAHAAMPSSVETLFSNTVEHTDCVRLGPLIGGQLRPFERIELV